jgi:hypothetical protein
VVVGPAVYSPGMGAHSCQSILLVRFIGGGGGGSRHDGVDWLELLFLPPHWENHNLTRYGYPLHEGGMERTSPNPSSENISPLSPPLALQHEGT